MRVAELLVDHGADVNAASRYRGIDEANPLFCACWTSENLSLVCRLLAHGARAGVSHLVAALGPLQRHGRAAFDVAEDGTDHATPGDNGHTPLAIARLHGKPRLVEWITKRMG